MVSLRSIATAVAGVALFFESSIASSVKRNAVNYVSFIDEAVINTPSHRIRADSHFDLLFSLHNGQQKIRLKLEPNHDILHESFAITHLGADGAVKSVETVKREEDMVYKGAAFIQRLGREGWTKAGWARIMFHRDGKEPVFEGTLRIDGNHHHIQTGANYQQLRHEDDPVLSALQDNDEIMVVWRDSDIMSFNPNELKKRDASSAALCNSDNLGFNSRFHELQDFDTFGAAKSRSLFGRQNFDIGYPGDGGTSVDLEESIGSVTGCPTSRRVALLGIATDCGYTAVFNSSQALRRSVIRMVNEASEVYESTFNISLGIQNLTISDGSCPGSPSETAPWNQRCSSSVDLSDRLNLFSRWRGQFEDTNAYWTLLSTCNTDSAVGLAWLGQLCRPGASSNAGGGQEETVAGANVVVRTSAEWQVFAHETGHTFGAVHDCTESSCPVSSNSQSCCPLSTSSCDARGDFIMNPSSRQGISEFSPCSIGNICSGFRRNVNAECLTDNRNVRTISGQQCGNGIVEEGEDCDCGGEEGCGDNQCCDPSTCRFRGEAECDNSNEDCCTDSCRFASSGTVCRSSTGPCDPEETCSGDSALCPKDTHNDDGDDCGDGLECASGQCTSRDEQCRANYQNTTSASDVRACSNSCLLSCETSDDGFCTQRNQNFLDGTPCGGGGGRCQNGNCEGASTWNEIQNWFRNNRNIAIPVGSVLAALLVLGVSCCCWSCIRRRMARRKAAKQPAMTAWPGYAPGTNTSNPQGGYTYAPLDNNNGWQGRTRSMRYA
ncbi:hypothetical protein F66182_3988 [Fusarium sp. NRRL 66182]|nr:hypothetical protein F66182_3988 [Fusarium sp. NRRL 66182]